MKSKLISTLFVALVVYMIVALIFILGPGFLIKTRVFGIYTTYLVPGPFFTADRIGDSYSLYVAWKVKDKWSRPICPAKDNFNRYNERFNPRDNYQNRFERPIYQALFVKPNQSAAGIKSDKQFQQLTQYLSDRYVRSGADSIRLSITRKRAQHFKTSLDTLYIIVQK